MHIEQVTDAHLHGALLRAGQVPVGQVCVHL